MAFNAKAFLDSLGIPSNPKRAGWIHTRCPFCQDKSMHLGFNIDHEYTNCWRCGYHNLRSSISAIAECNYKTAIKYIQAFQQKEAGTSLSLSTKKVLHHSSQLIFPPHTDLQENGRQYLSSRGFDPDLLEHIWDLKQTANYGIYKFRILAPIIFKGQPVSYQCRDFTSKQTPSYKACKTEDELIHHKHILYGVDYTKNRSCFVVEGLVDAWKIGPGALATFGTGFTQQQINLLVKLFDNIFIWFDPEDEAQAVADKMSNLLTVNNKHVEIIEGDTDPGDFNESEAHYIRMTYLNY